MIARPNIASILPPIGDDPLLVARLSVLLPDGTTHDAALDLLGALTIQRAIADLLMKRQAEFRRWLIEDDACRTGSR